MTFAAHEVHSRTEELALGNALIRGAQSRGLAVQLLAPNSSWATQRKLLLAQQGSMGVTVGTYAQFLADVWALHGDGRALVTAQQRRMLLRPLIGQVGLLGSEPSVQLVRMAAGFVEEAMAFGLEPEEQLSETESKVMELVALYERQLELKGLVEPVQAEELLNCAQLTACLVLAEEPPARCLHQRRFLQRLGKHMPVRVLQQGLPGPEPLAEGEPAQLRARLYRGTGGLQAGGAVLAGECHGAHAQPQLLVALLQQLHARGVAYEDVVAVPGVPAGAFPQLVDELAAANIPFEARFEVNLANTGLGAALVQLVGFSRAAGEEASYEDLASFLLSPYSGLAPDDARAVQERWRSAGHSTAQQRLDDLRNGFTAGQANSRMVQERLQPAVQLLDAPDAQRVQLLFANAQAAGLGTNALLDDRAAAEAALDFLEQAQQLGVAWTVEDLGNVAVTLQRASGPAQQAVQVVQRADVGLGWAPWVVLGGLDATTYPMAAKPDVFEGLRAKLGLATEDDTALQQRLLLANVLESCTEGFAFCRARHTPEGNESRPSALWDELLAAYRTPEDDAAGLPAHELPAALRQHAVRVSEAQLFFGGGAQAAAQAGGVAVERGVLHSPQAIALLPAQGGRAREFSPTQLEDYHRCPYLWFVNRRIGYNALDRELDQSALGTLFHDVMARFYPLLKEAGHERVTPENLPEAQALAQRAFAAQLQESQRHPRKGVLVRTQADKLQVEELLGQVLSFVERDAHFLPGFVPTYFEVGLASQDYVLEYATVPVRGAVDRIDVDAQGNAVVIDYKLSKLDKGYGLAREPFPGAVNPHVQTDIYARLVEKHFALQGTQLHVLGSVYRSYSANMLRGVYSSALDFGPLEGAKPICDALPKAGCSESYAAYLQRVEQVITEEVGRLAAGTIAPAPIEEGACRYCKARGFCPKGVRG